MIQPPPPLYDYVLNDTTIISVRKINVKFMEERRKRTKIFRKFEILTL